MMSAPPSHKRSRPNAAIALLSAILLFLVTIAVAPHVWGHHLTRQINEQARAVKRLEADASRMSALKQRLAVLSDQDVAASMLLQGNTAGLNGARLQRLVADMAARTGITLQSLRVADPESWKLGLRSIRLEIGLRAPLTQIQALLHEIETARPLMFIDTLTLAHPAQTEASIGGLPLDAWLTVRGVALEGIADGT